MADVVVEWEEDAGAPASSRADAPDEGDSAPGLPAHARLLADGTVRLPLRFPAVLRTRNAERQVREERFEALTLRRLTGADMRAISAAEAEDRRAVAIGRSAQIPPGAAQRLFDAMDAADIRDAAEVLSFFLTNGVASGP